MKILKIFILMCIIFQYKCSPTPVIKIKSNPKLLNSYGYIEIDFNDYFLTDNFKFDYSKGRVVRHWVGEFKINNEEPFKAKFSSNEKYTIPRQKDDIVLSYVIEERDAMQGIHYVFSSDEIMWFGTNHAKLKLHIEKGGNNKIKT